jgi:hypothetical protein
MQSPAAGNRDPGQTYPPTFTPLADDKTLAEVAQIAPGTVASSDSGTSDADDVVVANASAPGAQRPSELGDL